MFVTKEKIIEIIDLLRAVRKSDMFYIIFLILASFIRLFALFIILLCFIRDLRDFYLFFDSYHEKMLKIYDNIYEKNEYNNEKEIKELLDVKAYFFFKYPFHKHYPDICLYFKYFLFISYLMTKQYEKAYETIIEFEDFIEKHVSLYNREIQDENLEIKYENEERKRRNKKLKEKIPEVEYPRDYLLEEIEGKNLLFYVENEKDEYAVKLKELFLKKHELYVAEQKK